MPQELERPESWAKSEFPSLSSVQEAIVNALHLGNTRTAAFGHVGVAKTTFYRWMEEDGTFRDAVTRAENSAEVAYVGVLARTAWNGVDWRAAESWLKRRRREEWGDNTAIRADREAEILLAELFPEDAGANPAEVAAGAEQADADKPTCTECR